MSKTKLIAFYLPQYHETIENNKWWGKGFTEWTNTKKAKPLFDGHYQPREPYNDNYYNLLDKNTRQYQANLAKKYGIYGFCYYHYWFKGKKLLEKPLECIIELGEPEFPFCISWANEPWTRSWNGNKKEVLMPQDYGNEDDWKEHYDYLHRIFSDKRYILIDNKPLMLLYRTENIHNCDEMINYWDKLCKKDGFNGIYIVETLNSFQKKAHCNLSEAVVEFEPMLTIRHYLPLYINGWRYIKKNIRKYHMGNVLDILDYDFVWKQILRRSSNLSDKQLFKGAFVDWDNTSRRGENAFIIKGATPEKFQKYLSMQIKKTKKIESEFLFINAWNEWAEGTYLEPDKKYGYEYLKAVKEALIATN